MKHAAQPLRPEDRDAKRRREILADAARLSDQELLDIAVRAGILTRSGDYTKPYRDEASRGTLRLADETPKKPRLRAR